MTVKEETYVKPASLKEALELAHSHGAGSRFIAGGTDLLPGMFSGTVAPSCLIDISELQELKEVKKNGKHLQVGAGLSLDDLAKMPELAKTFPALCEVAGMVAGPVIRKTATLGGNLLCDNRCIFYNQSEWWREAAGYCLKCEGDICIATGGKRNCFSKFSSDLAVALISMNAYAEIAEKDQSYMLHVEDMYTKEGIKPHLLKCGSLIRAVYIPLGEDVRTIFRKLRKRESMDFGSLTSAVSLNKLGRVKIVLGGVDPGPVVVEGRKADDREDLIRQALRKARTVNNDVFSREYRREMIKIFIRTSLEKLCL